MQIPLLREKIASWAGTVLEKSAAAPEPPTTAMGPLARLTVLLAAVCPALVMSDTPANIPRISSISFSGNGCPAEPQWAGGFDNLMISYNQFNAKLPGEKANLNCQVHLQGTGGSPGWQVALRETWVQGHLVLAPGTKLDYWSSAFFSQDAGRTVSTN